MSSNPSSDTALIPAAPVVTPDGNAPSDTMTMLEHLSELRNRLMVMVTSAVLGIVAAFFYSVPVIELLKAMAAPIVKEAKGMVEFVQITPGEVLMASLKLSVCLGLAAASPIILYQILRFVLPGLKGKEAWRLMGTIAFGTVLFACGVAFAYFLVIPSALTYLLDYGQQVAKSQISIAQYIDFCLSLLLLTGVVFELPLLLFFLSLTGLISSNQLISQWRQAIVVIALAAAVITPSQDPLTMILVALAMVGLYFVSILPIRLVGR